jgi:DNA-binding transcriptional ArsR family regulator
MRRTAPALLPVFRSRLQADILAALLLHPDREISLTDLARQVGAPLTTVHGEARRLTAAGILARRQAGRSAMLRADPASRLTRPLTDLLVLSWGPQHVIAEEFASLDGAERVLIFGSWAARYHEQPGPQPNDVDVLVIGAPSRDDVYDAADRAQFGDTFRPFGTLRRRRNELEYPTPPATPLPATKPRKPPPPPRHSSTAQLSSSTTSPSTTSSRPRCLFQLAYQCPVLGRSTVPRVRVRIVLPTPCQQPRQCLPQGHWVAWWHQDRAGIPLNRLDQAPYRRHHHGQPGAHGDVQRPR